MIACKHAQLQTFLLAQWRASGCLHLPPTHVDLIENFPVPSMSLISLACLSSGHAWEYSVTPDASVSLSSGRFWKTQTHSKLLSVWKSSKYPDLCLPGWWRHAKTRLGQALTIGNRGRLQVLEHRLYLPSLNLSLESLTWKWHNHDPQSSTSTSLWV